MQDKNAYKQNFMSENITNQKPAPVTYSGVVVYLFAYDIAYELKRDIKELQGQPVAQFIVDSSKRSPRHLFFYKPQVVTLQPWVRKGPKGEVRVERSVKLLPVGAISITIKVPFESTRLEDLVDYHDLHFGGDSLNDEVRKMAEEIRNELVPHCIRPMPSLADEEAYTVFCINAPLMDEKANHIRGEQWFKTYRKEIAALLTQEENPSRLAKQEIEESTVRSLSYYEHDLVVVDWDSSLIVDQKENFNETVYAMELANLQLAELEAYDRILDDSLDRCYRDLSLHAMKGRRSVLKELREIRIDLARCSDELQNITKFFGGDWHIARVYESIATRFHLSDWHRTIDSKLATLDNMYQMLSSDRNNQLMLSLEVTIVLLFIIDLVILFVGLK